MAGEREFFKSPGWPSSTNKARRAVPTKAQQKLMRLNLYSNLARLYNPTSLEAQTGGIMPARCLRRDAAASTMSTTWFNLIGQFSS